MKNIIKALLAAALLSLTSPALAATLYVSEFPNAMAQVGSTSPQVLPQPAITDQAVTISGTSAQSSAFNAGTHAVLLTCDSGCSIVFGSNPTATTSNVLLPADTPTPFVVVPGQKVAAIVNSSGGGGGAPVTQGTSPWIVAGGGTAGTAATGVVTVQGIASGTSVATSNATQLPAALGQTTMAASLPVALASNQSALAVTLPTFTSITASATGTTGATAATLAATSGKTTYICGFTISSDATAALAGAATVTGTITGSLNYIQNVGSATAAGILTQNFTPCIPASASNTTIAVTSVAAGTGGNTAVTAWGYQQ